MITVCNIRDTLRFRFGSDLVNSPGFSEGLVRLLQSYAPSRDTFITLSRKMEDYLFNALYNRLGPEMTYRLDDGSFRRIHMSELPSVADEALYPLFASLKPYSVHYDQLHSFWMETGSFSAMRALYIHFHDFLPDQERSWIERIARENLPPALLESWLTEKG